MTVDVGRPQNSSLTPPLTQIFSTGDWVVVQARAQVIAFRVARSRLVPGEITSPAAWAAMPNAVIDVISQ